MELQEATEESLIDSNSLGKRRYKKSHKELPSGMSNSSLGSLNLVAEKDHEESSNASSSDNSNTYEERPSTSFSPTKRHTVNFLNIRENKSPVISVKSSEKNSR